MDGRRKARGRAGLVIGSSATPVDQTHHIANTNPDEGHTTNYVLTCR